VAVVALVSAAAAYLAVSSDGPARGVRLQSQIAPLNLAHGGRGDRHNKAAALMREAERDVGELLMTGFSGTLPPPGLLAAIRERKVGGVILFGENISPRLPEAIKELQAAARRGGTFPLLIATDQEGGPIRRFPEGPPFPSTRAIKTAAEAYHQGLLTGRFLVEQRVNIDLAPVSDVSGAQDFERAQQRGFNGSPQQVAALVEAFIRGLQAARVAATAKHFPGIGTLPVDTDSELQRVAGTVSEIEERDLPFRRAIAAGVQLVMVANAIFPALDPYWPATLSRRIQEGFLRRTFGFNGVIITDALDGPPLPGSVDERVLHAVQSGADIALLDSETVLPGAYATLREALRTHRLAPRTVLAASARLAALRRWLER